MNDPKTDYLAVAHRELDAAAANARTRHETATISIVVQVKDGTPNGVKSLYDRVVTK